MSKSSRYSDMMPAISMLLVSGDVGNWSYDISMGVKFVPDAVIAARRAGKVVKFHAACQNSTCCWYWQMPDGSKIYNFERHHFERLRDKYEGVCPECGNTHIGGGTIKA